MVNHLSGCIHRAIECKEKGNKHFQSGEYWQAEKSYTEAIQHDPLNPQLYTNRAMVYLKLSVFERVISDTKQAISLVPSNMKAYFQLAQAQLATNCFAAALDSSKKARELCLDELYLGRKDGNSIGPITDLVLRCKKENWEEQEKERERKKSKLLNELLFVLEERRDEKIKRMRMTDHTTEEIKNTDNECCDLSEELRRVCRLASGEPKREVPDWSIDNITFSVMLDPVVTKTGQSYDRASILEHLKRSETDPLTREPLQAKELRPNLALRDACHEFLQQNGWAVDW